MNVPVEFDTDDQALLLVFNVPQQEKKDNHFEQVR